MKPETEDEIAEFRANVEAVFAEMTDLLERKRRSYGRGNLTQFGGFGIAVRASDKVWRLANLFQKGELTASDGESVEDAFKDLIGYGVLGLLLTTGDLY